VRVFFGAVATGALVVVAHGLRVPQPLALAATIAAGVVAAVLSRRSRAAAPGDGGERPGRNGRVEAAALLVLLLVPAASTALRALSEPVIEWDGLELWFAKARGIYAWASLRDSPIPSYPELGPALWVLPVRWSGLEFEGVGRALLSLAFFLWVAALPAVLAGPATVARIGAALLVGFAAFDSAALTNGYQDALLLSAAGFAGLVLARILVRIRASGEPLDGALASFAARPDGRAELRVGGFLAGVLPLVKLEGAVWSLLLGTAFLGTLAAGPWIRSPGRMARALRPFLVPWIATALVWPALVAWNGIEMTLQDGAFSAASIGRVFANLDRWGTIEPYFEQYLRARGGVIGACAAASLCCVLLVPRLARALVFLWIVFAAHVAFLAFVFLTTTLDLSWHISTSFDRLVFQAAFTWVLAGAVALPSAAEALWSTARDFREPAR
jgi:hypothetical protein